MTDTLPQGKALARSCPSCRAGMLVETFERKAGGSLDLDFCHSCQVIWFDQYESAQLTPGAVMKLFESIHRHRDARPRPLAQACLCPVCRQPLRLTDDIQRSNRISYYRCASSHGRLSTFHQFLREKNFIRSLTVAEIDKLKAVVRQVRCTSCGAPVNLERDSQCSFCRAPLAILDPDAVQRTLAELSAEERKRRTVDPHAAVDALLAGQRGARENPALRSAPIFEARSSGWNNDVVDLVGEVLDLFMRID